MFDIVSNLDVIWPYGEVVHVGYTQILRCFPKEVWGCLKLDVAHTEMVEEFQAIYGYLSNLVNIRIFIAVLLNLFPRSQLSERYYPSHFEQKRVP